MIPHTMTFIDHAEGCNPEGLVLATGPVPSPGRGEVLIRVRAAGVNRPDVAQRKGVYPPPPGANPVLGLEVAGEVAALGEDADRWTVGDRVCALVNGGGYAEYCVAPAGQCLPQPAGYDPVRSAALPETGFTVWANLFGAGGLRPGETVLVHGGGSGIGTTAIALAREFGSPAYATAGSDERCRRVEDHGAVAAINYREADFVAALRGLTDGRGVDVVLDMVGGPYLSRNLECLAPDGRLVIISTLGGTRAESVDLRAIMQRRLRITGSTLRPRSAAEKAAIADALRDRVWPVLEAGRCAPVIDRVIPWHRAAEAHRAMERGEQFGKIVLQVA